MEFSPGHFSQRLEYLPKTATVTMGTYTPPGYLAVIHRGYNLGQRLRSVDRRIIRRTVFISDSIYTDPSSLNNRRSPGGTGTLRIGS